MEILGASDVLIDKFENIIAAIAFDIMDTRKCYPGYIAENVINQYIEDGDMKHVLLTDPFIWENAKSISIDHICVAWLMVVPISEREYEHAQTKSVKALEKLYKEKEIDIYNLYRKSVI